MAVALTGTPATFDAIPTCARLRQREVRCKAEIELSCGGTPSSLDGRPGIERCRAVRFPSTSSSTCRLTAQAPLACV